MNTYIKRIIETNFVPIKLSPMSIFCSNKTLSNEYCLISCSKIKYYPLNLPLCNQLYKLKLTLYLKKNIQRIYVVFLKYEHLCIPKDIHFNISFDVTWNTSILIPFCIVVKKKSILLLSRITLRSDRVVQWLLCGIHRSLDPFLQGSKIALILRNIKPL